MAAQINFDTTYGSAGTIIHMGVTGNEGFLFVTPDRAKVFFGEEFDHLSLDGPGLVSAFDADGTLLGSISASTGQWVLAEDLQTDDMKQAIDFEGKLEIVAQQVLDEEITLAEATTGMTIEQRLELSSIFVENHCPEKINPQVMGRNDIKIDVEQGLPSSACAVPAIIEDGKIVFLDATGEQIKTDVSLSFFTDLEEMGRLFTKAIGKDINDTLTPEIDSGFKIPGITIMTAKAGKIIMPAIILDSATEALTLELKRNENSVIAISVGVPHFDKQGNMLFMQTLHVPMSCIPSFPINLDSALVWNNYQKPGLKLDVLANSPLGDGAAGKPLLISLEAGGGVPNMIYEDKTEQLTFTALASQIFIEE
jgi:hypothetical protein